MSNPKKLLKSFFPCQECLVWYHGQDSQEAWQTCERGDWMLWVAARLGVDRKLIVLAACDCAETALHFVDPLEIRPKEAVATARRWCQGAYTSQQVRQAAADATAAAYAADAAAYAADAVAADDADTADAYAADAATYAADAYAADAYAAAAIQSGRAIASLVRERISWKVISEAIQKLENKE